RRCLLVVVLVALGCAGRLDDVRGVDAYIKEVEFVGVKRFTEAELLEYLHMGETSRLPWKDRFVYQPANIPGDSERIVEVYRAHGYYDAEVVLITPTVRPGRVRLAGRGKGERRPGKARLRVVVHEGEPTLVRGLKLEFPDGRPGQTRADPKVSEGALRRQVQLAEGKPFEVAKLTRSSEALLETLREAGYARAEVKETAEVTPGVGAEVRF